MNWILRTFTLPVQGSTLAADIDNLYLFITWVSAFFFTLIAALLAFFLLRYRRRQANEITPHISHNFALEVTWSVIPLLICFVIFFWGFHGFVRANVAPGESMEIQVVAKKWQWQFEYPDGTRSLNELHVPVGKPIRLVMTSEDVLHSFFVPTFRVKHDIVPGRYTDVWFTPTILGPQQVFCTEYCGKGHSDMLARVVVDDEAKYRKWLEEGDESMKSMPLPELGKLVWENKGCNSCHTLDGSASQGPTWKGLYGKSESFTDGTSAVVDETYIRNSLMDPNAKIVRGFENIMPTYQGLLREREILGVIAFMKSLK